MEHHHDPSHEGHTGHARHDHDNHGSHHAGMTNSESSAVEYVKFAGVISAIFLASFVLYRLTDFSGLAAYLRWFMGVFFVTFAGFKFAGYSMFAMMFAGYDVVAKKFKPYAYAYPFIELFLGILYIANLLPTTRDILTVLVMGVSAVGVAQEIRKRSGIHCACLGNVIKLPLSTVSLVEDVSMGLMAIVMLVL